MDLLTAILGGSGLLGTIFGSDPQEEDMKQVEQILNQQIGQLNKSTESSRKALDTRSAANTSGALAQVERILRQTGKLGGSQGFAALQGARNSEAGNYNQALADLDARYEQNLLNILGQKKPYVQENNGAQDLLSVALSQLIGGDRDLSSLYNNPGYIPPLPSSNYKRPSIPQAPRGY